jgi:hypothetical protein
MNKNGNLMHEMKKSVTEKSLEHATIHTTVNVHAQNQVSVLYTSNTSTNGTFLK